MFRSTLQKLHAQFTRFQHSPPRTPGVARLPPECPRCGAEWRSHGLPLDCVAVQQVEGEWVCQTCGEHMESPNDDDWDVI